MYLGYFLSSFILTLFLTWLVRKIMLSFKIVDEPKMAKRKIHKKNIPLGGGLAIFLSFFLIVFYLIFFTENIGPNILSRHIFGFFIGGTILMIGGFLDDKFCLSAKQQILFPILAILVIISFGIGPHVVTNPLGGFFQLDNLQISIDGLGNFVVWADLLVFIWLITMMFTTKLLDGLDGLVSGIVLIGALMIGFLSLQDQWLQPDTALISFIFAGACLGFLVWNWHPAKIFLGEGGSLFVGFMLGGLAIISGGKIATTLLVIAIPLLDIIRVVIRRVQLKKPFYVGDSEHLHFRLLQSGLSQRQAVLLFYAISFLFGVSTLFLQSSQKLMALTFLFVLMILLGIYFSKKK